MNNNHKFSKLGILKNILSVHFLMTKINNKQFLLISIIWFLIFYLILWVLSGACTSLFVAPSEEATVCLTKSNINFLAGVPLVGLFFPITPWVSLFYWFSPIFGFIAGYFTIKWWNNNFESKEATSIFFPILMIFILLIGFTVNLAWFYGEYVSISNSRNPQLNAALYFCFDQDASVCNNTINRLNTELQQQAVANNSSKVTQYLGVNFWQQLKSNILLTFIFGTLAAWILLFSKDLFESKRK